LARCGCTASASGRSRVAPGVDAPLILGSLWIPSVPSLAPFSSFSALRSSRITGYSHSRDLPRQGAKSVPSYRLTLPKCVLMLAKQAPPGRPETMTFGLRCSQPACRPHQASLSVRVPMVESLLPASFSFALRLTTVCRHRLRLAPFIQRDSAQAGHTGAGCQPAADWQSASGAIISDTSSPKPAANCRSETHPMLA
jgi:hypothetical protein